MQRDWNKRNSWRLANLSHPHHRIAAQIQAWQNEPRNGCGPNRPTASRYAILASPRAYNYVLSETLGTAAALAVRDRARRYARAASSILTLTCSHKIGKLSAVDWQYRQSRRRALTRRSRQQARFAICLFHPPAL